MSRLRIVLLGGAAALALAGCSSSGDSSPASSKAETPTPTTSSPSPTPSTSTPAPSSTAPSTTRAPSRTATPSSTAPSSATSAPAFTTTCADLSVMVIPGGAIRGAEIAAVQYVNEGKSACTITGTPSAVLLRNGSTVGSPAEVDGSRVAPFTLQPGDVGESLLRDFSTCNAPLSDSIRVSTPTRGGAAASSTVVRPAKLRACRLQLAPVGRPA